MESYTEKLRGYKESQKCKDTVKPQYVMSAQYSNSKLCCKSDHIVLLFLSQFQLLQTFLAIILCFLH